jgi:hypothetical protein
MLFLGAAPLTCVLVVFPADRLTCTFLLGAYVASVPWGLWNAALIMGGGATWRAGAEAEKWTGNELGLLGPRWRIEHGIPLRGNQSRPWRADVDHVAIGPYGVIVAETKFSTSDPDLESDPPKKKLREAIDQVERNMRDIRKVLGADKRIPFISVVIWWGPGVGPLGSIVRRDGDTRVVRGVDADQWRSRIASGDDRISEEVVDLLTVRLREYVHQEIQDGGNGSVVPSRHLANGANEPDITRSSREPRQRMPS